ncbi:dienelactone hydrolase family protein [Alteromonas aestuariivivens]|uniref:Dienelactone hydrolase family protein n=1 Tax=Alteromonas aestuariivivens TaxID=1938339 RepID=A0A3D8M322_9ALTE|nr:dienelactone hydrolase family protein [Alteromonas aestuariivivens]RDV24113.1 dienelactone hydrolase family protein [Alteromonas aestuariivivens]
MKQVRKPYSKHSIPQQAFDWYDDYAHGRMDRRTFLSRLATLSVMGFSVPSLLGGLTPDYAQAEQVSFNDPAIKASFQIFPSPSGHGEGRGYWVAPTGTTETRPGVLVVHENRGLNPYIKDVARRLAKAGFVAFAPDALYPVGGYPGNDDAGRDLQRNLSRHKIEADFLAAASFLKGHSATTSKTGAVGFCFGGYMVNYLVAAGKNLLDAGVVFYGTPAAEELQNNINTPLLIHLAGLDERVNSSWPSYESKLRQLKADFEMHEYEGANHGFHNDSTARYSPGDAELAWQRTLAFFDRHLR